MVTIIGTLGGKTPEISLCEDAPAALKAKNPEDTTTDEQIFTHLKKTNRVCSPLFAAFVPVNESRLSDIFFPLSTHCVEKPSVFRSALAIVADVATVPIRLITFLPRALYNSINSPENIWNPIKKLAQNDIFSTTGPCYVTNEKEAFYFSEKPMHESEVKERFRKNIERLDNISQLTLRGKQEQTVSKGIWTSSGPDPQFEQSAEKIRRLCGHIFKKI